MAYLLHSKKTKLHGKAVKGFPLILWNDDKVHWVALHYMLDKYNGENLSSIGLYGQHLQDLFTQIEGQDGYSDAQDLDDDFLKAFKQSILERNDGKTNRNYAKQVLGTVIRYCKWLEDEGFSRNLIGETKLHRIRIKITDKGKLQHRLAKSNKLDTTPLRAPRTNWIELIKPYGPKTPRVLKRFCLMMDWARVLGLRGHEVTALKTRDVPSLKAAEKAILTGNELDIKLTVTKGSKDAVVRAQPLLVKQTRDYIDTLRDEVVADVIKKNKKAIAAARKTGKPIPPLYKDEGYLFLSEGTGTKLHDKTFSNQVRSAFLVACEAGVLSEEERVWTQGLRHNFVVIFLKKQDKAGVPRPEAVTRQASRHGSDKAMEPYITERYNPTFE